MSYEAHPTCVTPSDDAVLWRYTELVKFIDLLENRRLWFTRLDRPGDPREGCLTDLELRQLRDAASPENAEAHLRAVHQTLRQETFVNCWTERAESMALWDLHAQSPGGLVIKSTVGRLKQTINDVPDRIYIARVEYIDWATAPWPNNVFGRYVRKVRAFEHEKEVRLMIWLPGSSFPAGAGLDRLHNALRPSLVKLPSVERIVWKRMYQAAWDKACSEHAQPNLSVQSTHWV